MYKSYIVGLKLESKFHEVTGFLFSFLPLNISVCVSPTKGHFHFLLVFQNKNKKFPKSSVKHACHFFPDIFYIIKQ